MLDVDKPPRFREASLQLLSFLLGKLAKVSLLSLGFLYPLCFFNSTSLTTSVISPAEKSDPYETPTLPWPLFLHPFII